MAKNYSSRIQTENFFPILLVLSYLCIGFVPNWEAVDKIAPQWLVMTIINLISALYIGIYLKSFNLSLNVSLRTWISVTYISFILWAGISYYYAINPTEVIVNIARQINVFLMFLFMSVFFHKVKSKSILISSFILIILSVEIYAVINQAMQMIESVGYISSGNLKGVTANRNITAFSIAIKIPFALYLIYLSKKNSIKILLSLIVFLSILCLTLIESRAAFLALGLILFSYLLLNTILFLKSRKSIKKLLVNLYFILPLFFAVLINQIYYADKGVDAVSRAATISFGTNDGSVNQRLRYYEDVYNHVLSNPIFGVGLGNWKLKSIEYDNRDITGYIVPYHAHSDFIQLGAELGIIGFFLYLGIFLITVFLGLKIIWKSKISEKDKVFIFILIISLGVYSIDANLNFPIARPQVLIVWTALLAIINNYIINHSKLSEKGIKYKFINPIFIASSIFTLVFCLYVTNTTYNSLKGQMVLLRDFNSNAFTVPINRIDDFVPEMPNITVTTIPMKSVKARYYFNAKKYDKALKLLSEGTKANPHLYYSELLKSQIFLAKGNIDSAYYYGRKAFYNLPNNSLHSTNYVNILIQKADIIEINKAFELLTYKDNKINWKNYLVAASNFTPPGNKILTERAKIAKEKFIDDLEFDNLYKTIAVGNQNFREALNISQKALDLYNTKNYKLAAEYYQKAIDLNPLEFSYRENAAASYYLIGDLINAEKHIDVVLNEMNPLTGKAEYIKAIIFIAMGDNLGACPFLQTSLDSGYEQARQVYDQNCI